MTWFHLFLFLHVTAAVIAFGPTFTFPLVASLARKSPQNMPFALSVIIALEGKLVIPFAVSMPVTGLLMAFNISIDWGQNVWLIAALIVYAFAITFAITVQAPTVHRMHAMLTGGHGVPSAAPAPLPAGPGAAAAGPPAEFLAMAKRMQIGGMLLSLAFFTIMVLMIWKPGGNL